MSLPDPRLTRRVAASAVPLTISATVLAGCRWGPETDTDEVASGTTPPPRDADAELVDRAITAISATATVVAGATATRPALRKPLAGFSTLHEAHLRHLEAEPETGAADDDAPRRLPGVLAAERELQDTLIGLADDAGSGRLARSLASMAAGVAQHLAVVAEAR